MGTSGHSFREVRRGGVWAPSAEVCDHCTGTGVAEDEPWTCSSCGNEVYDPGSADYDDGHTPEGKCIYAPGTRVLISPRCRNCDDSFLMAPDYHITRDYALFAILSGVRGPIDSEFTKDDRGLPPDVSALVGKAVAGWGSDMHSTGWYTVGELRTRSWDDFPDFKLNHLEELEALLDPASGVGPDDVRIILGYGG